MRGAGWDATTAPLRLSRLAEQANRLNLKATVAQTISQIIATYRELLRAQEQLVIVQEALKRSTLLEVNKALISAGRMAEFEIVQTEADIATQQLGVEEARNQLDTSRLALLRLLAWTCRHRCAPPSPGSQPHGDRQTPGLQPRAKPAAGIPRRPARQPAGRPQPGDRQGFRALAGGPGGRRQPDTRRHQ